MMHLLLLIGVLIQAESDPFEPFKPLLDKAWQTTFADGVTTDNQYFKMVYDGKFMHNHHEVKDASGKVIYHGETYYAWDYRGKKIDWYYFNSTGGHLVGHLVRTADGYDVEGTNYGPGEQTEAVKGHIILGTTEWSSVDFFLKEGQWTERFRVTYKPKL